MTLELEIDVPESRQVTLTLPPEVPVGKVKLTVRAPGEPSRLERFGFLREIGPVMLVVPEDEADTPQVVAATPAQ